MVAGINCKPICLANRVELDVSRLFDIYILLTLLHELIPPLSVFAGITEGGAPKLLNQLAQIYIALGTTYAPDGAPQGYITHITAESIHGNGPWSK
ncbi:MAG: hypothetical protein WAJ93_04880 [Candidatus Nitrosopolaris sp.]